MASWNTHVDLERREGARDLEAGKIGRLGEDAVLSEEGERSALEDVQLAPVRVAAAAVVERVEARLQARAHEELQFRIQISAPRVFE